MYVRPLLTSQLPRALMNFWISNEISKVTCKQISKKTHPASGILIRLDGAHLMAYSFRNDSLNYIHVLSRESQQF